MRMANTRLVILSIVVLWLLAACRREGPAEVKKIVAHEAGAIHAVLLFQYGHSTVGTRTYVAIVRGTPPKIGDQLQVEEYCHVFTAYRTGPWKMTWNGGSQIDLAIDGPINKDYESTIEQKSCDGISSRWHFEDPPG